MMPAIKKDFDLTGEDIVYLSTEKQSLKIETGSYGEERLEKSKAKLLKQNVGEERANLILSRLGKQMKKQN